MNIYQQRVLEGASGVELTVALYDGMIRFLREAERAVDRNDVPDRRRAVKRAMEILFHLQATLRMDVGGDTAATLAEFYAATLALLLQGSTECSKEKFDLAITQIWTVREAWRQAAADPKLSEKVAVASRSLGHCANLKECPQISKATLERELTSSWTA